MTVASGITAATVAVVLAMAMVGWRALQWRLEAMARACHELRGPITAARLGLELSSRLGEVSAARLQAIDVELRRASLALEDLDGVRDRRPVTHQAVAFELQELIADSVEAWQPAAQAAGKQLQWRCSGPPVILRGDRLRLAQAAENLIANAIRHGGCGIVVSGGLAGGSGSPRAVLEVADDGAGLPAPVAELTRRARGGRGAHGRGLAIAASIASAHGGRLTAAPTEHGARLVLELALCGPARHTPRARAFRRPRRR